MRAGERLQRLIRSGAKRTEGEAAAIADLVQQHRYEYALADVQRIMAGMTADERAGIAAHLGSATEIVRLGVLTEAERSGSDRVNAQRLMDAARRVADGGPVRPPHEPAPAPRAYLRQQDQLVRQTKIVEERPGDRRRQLNVMGGSR